MEIGAFDHIFAGILIAGLPMLGVWEYRCLTNWVNAGVGNARLRGYYWVMTQQWVLLIVAVGLWLSSQRDIAALGLGFEPGTRLWIGIAVALVASTLLTVQTVVVLRSRERLLETSKQFEPMRPMLPHNDGEGRAFAALSFTAGICEELLYRGFLIAYFAAILGTWPAVVLSSLAFGLGHVYQGAIGILKTGAIGLVLGALYVLAGSLWAPMLVHIVLDLNSGHLGRKVIEMRSSQEVT